MTSLHNLKASEIFRMTGNLAESLLSKNLSETEEGRSADTDTIPYP